MRVHKTYRYRVYPNKGQIAKLAVWEPVLRFLWNLCNQQRLNAYRRCKVDRHWWPSSFNQQEQLTELRAEYPWIRAVPRRICDRLLDDLNLAWIRCFKKLTSQPKYKSRRNRIGSFCAGDSWRINGNLITFPKLGKLPISLYRKLEGKPKSCRLLNEVDQWFVHIECEVEIQDPAPRVEPIVAVDMGVTYQIADSNGILWNNPLPLKKSLNKLRRAQRSLNRKQKGSCNYQKAAIRVAKIHRKVKRQRTHTAHVRSKHYAESQGIVVREDLRINNMVRNHHLSRSILDSGWGQFNRFLQYKIHWNGGAVVPIPPHYSSQTCSNCQHVDSKSRNGVMFNCTACGYRDHADINAAIVLKQRFIKDFKTPEHSWGLLARAKMPVEGLLLLDTLRSRKEKVTLRKRSGKKPFHNPSLDKKD